MHAFQMCLPRSTEPRETEQPADLLAQFRRITLLVNRDGMLDRGFDQLGYAVRGNHDRAVHFARILPAIDVLAFHGDLLRSPKSASPRLDPRRQAGPSCIAKQEG